MNTETRDDDIQRDLRSAWVQLLELDAHPEAIAAIERAIALLEADVPMEQLS